MRRPRRNHSPAFKARVALEAIRGEKAVAQIADRYDLNANQVTAWKQQALENLAGTFGSAPSQDGQERIDQLHAKIGELTVERDFLERALRKFPRLSAK